jgi:hypothetical protein
MDREQSINAMKMAYRNICGDTSAGTEETQNALCDALCEEIGDDAFVEFCDSFDNF